MSKIELNERFHIFDNFLISNKHLLNKGNNEWNSSRIFFNLSIDYGDNSPLTKDADKFENEGKTTWNYYKATTRPNEMRLSPVLKYIDLEINQQITCQQILSDGKFLYCFDKMNEILIYDYITEEKFFLQGHERPPIGAVEIDNIIISYEIYNSNPKWVHVMIWKNYELCHTSNFYDDLQKIEIINQNICFIFSNHIDIYTTDELSLLYESSNFNEVDSIGILSQEEIDALLDISEDNTIISDEKASVEILSEEEIEALLDNIDISEEVQKVANCITEIDSKVSISCIDVKNIYFFMNNNIVLASLNGVEIYTQEGEFKTSIVCNMVVGLHQNNLYLVVDRNILIYDENIKLKDEYNIQEFEKFNKESYSHITFFDDKIVTSENELESDGVFAVEDKFIDSEVKIWNRGKIEHTITSHVFGADSFVFNDYLVTYGIDGHYIWDKNLNLVGHSLDIHFFKSINHDLALSNNKIVDFKLLLNCNDDYRYMDTVDQINQSSGTYIDQLQKTLTYGYKTLYLWDDASYNPIKQYSVNGQIKDYKQFEEYIVLVVMESIADDIKKTYIILDLFLNELMKFKLFGSMKIYILNKADKIIFYNSQCFCASIANLNTKTITQKEYRLNTTLHVIEDSNYIACSTRANKFYIEYFDTKNYIIKDIYYQNDLLHYCTSVNKLEIKFFQEGLKEIFWIDIGKNKIIVILIQNNKVDLNVFNYNFENNLDLVDVFSPHKLQGLKIIDDKYIFFDAYKNIIFNQDGTFQEVVPVTNEDVFAIINGIQVSNNYNYLISTYEKGLITFNGRVIKILNNTIVLNSNNRVKYIEYKEKI